MLIYLQMIGSEEERAFFERLYLEYRQLMFYVARRLLPSDADAEDAVHQAFLSIIENLKNFSDIKCPETKAFCVLVTENKAIDILRSRKHLAWAALEEAAAGIEVPLPGDGGLADAMTRLPARYRQALLLRFYMGYSVREMASILGMSQGAVQKLLWRSKEALRRALEKEGSAL